MSSSTATITMTPQELQTLVFNAVQEAMAKASPAPRRRNTKNAAPAPSKTETVPPSSASVAGSTTSKRSLGAKTQEHIDQGIQVTAIVKRLLTAQNRKMTGGIHLKVGGYLKPTLASGTPLTDDLVRDAISFLDANPDYKSKNQQAKASKAPSAPAPTNTSSSTTEAPTTNEAPKKARGRPKKAADEAKPAKATKPKKAAPPPPAESESESDSNDEDEDEDVDMLQINIGGTDYFWNEENGDVYEITEGTIGDRIGSSTDGKTIEYA